MFGRKLRQVLLGSLTAGALCLAVGTGPANALGITDQTMVGGAGIKLWSDNSAEILINADGTFCTAVVGSCTVDVGDRLRGIVQINTVENIAPIPSGTRPIGSNPVNELTGLFETLVTSKSCIGPICTFTFGASGAAFDAEAAGLGFAGATDVAFYFFEDTTLPPPGTPGDFTRTGTVPAGEASATNGTAYLSIGFDASAATDWVGVSFVGDSIGSLGAGVGGFFNAGLSVKENYTGMDFLTVACPFGAVAFCVDGTFKGPSAGDFDAWDDANFTFAAVAVPEPASLSLFGIGLLGLGFLSRRRNKRRAA